jgi:hypothetical protein
MTKLLTCAILMCSACTTVACLREQVDERAIQWSTQILEAKLIEVSERVQMRALAVKPPAGGTGEISAVYWNRVYSFQVEKVIESAGNSVKPRHRVEVVRFFGKVDDPNAPAAPAGGAATGSDPCIELLTRASLGKSFVLLLRPEQDIKMHKPPVWADPKNTDPRDAEVHGLKAYAVIHLIPKDKATDAGMTKLRKVLAETRAAEKKVPDAEIKKQIEVMLKAPSDSAAEHAIAALTKVGYKAVVPIKSARDRKETTPEAKQRLAKLAIDLSPPPLDILMGEHAE